jgi:hypothetical protein
MFLTLFLANNYCHSKIGRQLWAEFEFGENKSLLRFRPSPSGDGGLDDDRPVFEEACTMEAFEKGCKLDEGVWPGPSQRKWNIRMRGINYESTFMTHFGEGIETTVVFSQLDDGRLSMSAELLFQNYFRTFKATKVAEVAAPGRNDLTIRTRWERYKPRQRMGMDVYKELVDETSDDEQHQPTANPTESFASGTSVA